MERLTDRCWRNLDPWECCGQNFHCSRKLNDDGGCINGCIVPKLYKHLAEYEDLEEQGLLLKLPCKVGTVAYLIDHNFVRMERKPIKCIIDEFTVDRYNDCYAVLNGAEKFYMMRRFRAINIKQFGETIFLIKEDAEKVLRDWRVQNDIR